MATYADLRQSTELRKKILLFFWLNEKHAFQISKRFESTEQFFGWMENCSLVGSFFLCILNAMCYALVEVQGTNKQL